MLKSDLKDKETENKVHSSVVCRGQKLYFHPPSEVFRGRQYIMSRSTNASKNYTDFPEYQPSCKLLGGKLAELKSQEELDAARDYNSKIVKHERYYFIGLYYRVKSDSWGYPSDRSEATFLPWSEVLGNYAATGKGCAFLLGSDRMDAARCVPPNFKNLRHLCEIQIPLC